MTEEEAKTYFEGEFYVGMDFLFRSDKGLYEMFESYYESGTEKKLICFSKGFAECPHCAAASYYPSHLASGIRIREPYYLVSDEFGGQNLFRVTDEAMLTALGVEEEDMEEKLKEVQEKKEEIEDQTKTKKPNLTIVS